jgi:hypothetical protein
MLNKDFILAGNAIFTLEIGKEFSEKWSLPLHYTYRISKKEATERFPETYFIGLLTGPNNTNDYTYMGIVQLNGNVKLTRKSKYTKDSWPYRLVVRALACVLNDKQQSLLAAGFDMHHEGRCGRCGRALTVPESVLSGFGPECIKLI